MKKVWAFDIGASNGRLMLCQYDGEQLILDEIYRFANHPVSLTNHYYWDILHIYNEMKKAMQASLQAGHEVESLGIDTWGVDFGLLSATGELLANPYCYRDPQNKFGMEKFHEWMSEEELFTLTGVESAPINSLYQLFTIKEQSPGLLEQADTLLLTPNLLTYFFTGTKASEFTISSTTQLLDIHQEDWSKQLISLLGVKDNLFAKIVPSLTIAGSTLPDINRELQMDPVQVIHVAGHDTASALAALPIEDDYSVFMSCGTWSLIGIPVKKALTTPNARRWGFTNEGTMDGTYRLLKNNMGMWLLQQSRLIWERDGIRTNYMEENQLFQQATPFRSLIDPDDPRFFNPKNMLVELRAYCRETEQPIPQSRGEIIRCIIDSLVMKYKLVIDQLETLVERKIKRIHIGGGVTKNQQLCQTIADATDREIIAGPIEASAVGNALGQLIALGEIRDGKEAKSIVKKSFPINSYLPNHDQYWQNAYTQFKELIE